jgi:phosphatidylglycerol:prolipoprotein diacylglycerol transferase
MPDYWVHNLSPFLLGPFSIGSFHDLGIRWYGLAYLAGLLIGYRIACRWVDQGRVPLNRAELQDFVLYSGLGMIIGGRLGYCLLYGFSELMANPLYLFKVMDGGMASHGGMIGMVIGMGLFCRKYKRSFLVLSDIVAATGTLGVGLGRIANFINGELWGRTTTVSWAVIFPNSGEKAPLGMPPNELHAWYLSHVLPRHPSQLYAALLEGFLIFIILLPIHAKHRRPGLTTALFLILYGLGRFGGEFFREPDFGQPVFWGWMSKGQLYTMPMLVIGAALTIWVMRRPARPTLYLSPKAAKISAPPSVPPSASNTPHQAR